MSSTLLASSKSHLLFKGRSGIFSRRPHHCTRIRSMQSFARSGVSSVVYKSNTSIGSWRYLSGLNGINISIPSRRLKDDDLDIPPLDLVSVLEVAKAKEAEQSANKAAVELLARYDIEIPPLDLLSPLDVANAKKAEKVTNTPEPAARINLLSIVPSESETNQPINENLPSKMDRIDTSSPSLLSVVPSPTVTNDRASKSIPYFAIGEEQSYQLSGRAKGLAEEITNLKRKLKTKIDKSHAARLVHEIEKKQRKIDELMNPFTSSVKAIGSVTNKNTASGTGSFAALESNRRSVVPSSSSNEDVSGRAKGLAEEITHLKRKLKTIKNKSHAARLAMEIESKQRKIDKLMNRNPGAKTEVLLSQIAQGLSKEIGLLQMMYENEDMTADRKAKLKHEIEMKQRKVDRLNKGELSNEDRRKMRRLGIKPIAPPRETKSYVLPLPKASSKGVLIPQFDSEVILTQASGTVLASSGTTSILSTVILVPPEQSVGDDNTKTFEHAVLDCIQKRSAANGSLFLPLQVEYRERWHASGKIPTHNQRRRDNSGPLTEREVLASRAIDRTLRPWLMKGLGESTTSDQWSGLLPENIVVNCQVQSYDTRSSTYQHRTHADPTALAINSAIAAIYQSSYSGNTRLRVPIEAAASIKLAMRHNGTVIYDPTPSEAEECAFELLFAGTRDTVLMFEFSAKGESVLAQNNEYNIDPGISEDVVSDALRLAKEAILPIIQHQEDEREKYSNTRAAQEDDANISDEELARILGLGSANGQQNDEVIISWSDESALGDRDYVQKVEVNTMLDEAYDFVWSKLEHAALKSFGYDGLSCNESSTSKAYVYQGNLPSKNLRGRRETLIQNEVERLLREEFRPSHNISDEYSAALSDGNSSFVSIMRNHIHERIMQQGFGTAASQGCRSDGRSLIAVRPISATAPIFPDCVHGSAVFSRGDTQVLSTATVSSPKDGVPLLNPLSKSMWSEEDADTTTDDDKMPIGSLRFLRSQVELESDMNSRRVKAGRELTGDSGILSEVKRNFLHYDFPDFSTGAIKSKAGGAANRRAIGHGNLAERAVAPVIPSPEKFPYSIRMTCEVTSSNGSSSMASACGATLSLLDAGVPISAPVAGVSVGLASGSDELLLDITGTEDHYGNMDLKVCGTFGGVTAIQCDVKKPVDLEIVIDGLKLAKQGRNAILREMDAACFDTLGGLLPRSTMKRTAPRVEVIRYDPNRKRDLIGPGGSVLRQLEDRFNVTIDLSQEGRCLIFGAVDTVKEAKDVILDLVGEVEVGGIYEGTVIDIRDFGAIIELLRNKEGLLHVSEIADIDEKHPGGNLGLVNDYLKVGQKIEVICTKIDLQGSIKLSRKQLLKKQQYNIKASQQMEKHADDYEVDNLLQGGDNDDSDRDGEYSDPEFDSIVASQVESLTVKQLDNFQSENDTESEEEFDDSITASEAELLTVPELKDKCRAAGLLVGGTKAELIQRLTEAQLVRKDLNEEPDLNLFTVPELKEKCREAGLLVGGTKAELIERLQEHNHELT